MLKSVSCALFLSMLLLITGCSKKESEVEKPQQLQPIDPATGMRPPNFVWGSERGSLANFYFEPTDSLRPIATRMRDKIEEIYRFCSSMLLYQPTEPIDMYCFSSPQTLLAHTSQGEPFMVDNRLYYGYGAAFGKPIAQFVMSKLPQGPSKFAFIREGLPVLFDFTGRNYHQAVNNFVIEGTLIPLDTILTNEAFQRREPRKREIEASSFCAYLLWEYGPSKFMQFYSTTEDFETAAKSAFGVEADQIYKQWLAFLPEHTDEKEAERESQMQQGGGQ